MVVCFDCTGVKNKENVPISTKLVSNCSPGENMQILNHVHCLKCFGTIKIFKK